VRGIRRVASLARVRHVSRREPCAEEGPGLKPLCKLAPFRWAEAELPLLKQGASTERRKRMQIRMQIQRQRQPLPPGRRRSEDHWRAIGAVGTPASCRQVLNLCAEAWATKSGQPGVAVPPRLKQRQEQRQRQPLPAGSRRYVKQWRGRSAETWAAKGGQPGVAVPPKQRQRRRQKKGRTEFHLAVKFGVLPLELCDACGAAKCTRPRAVACGGYAAAFLAALRRPRRRVGRSVGGSPINSAIQMDVTNFLVP